MKRERATRLLEDLLRRATSNEWPLSLIDEVFLFGDYLRGAVEPHDVDVDVEYTSDEQLRLESVGALLSGKDPMGVLRRALVGRSRGIELQYGLRGRVHDIEMLLLWRRGDTLDTALTRLHAIAVDPTAGRAPRDAMLPAFDGLDQWVPRSGL